MRQIFDVRVYAPGKEDAGEGLVGALSPISCTRQETLNGDDVVTLVHPYDPYGKWRALSVGNVLKCYAIGRVSPNTSTKIQTLREAYSVNMGTTSDERDVFEGLSEESPFVGRLDNTSTISAVYECVDGMYRIDARISGSNYIGVYVAKAAIKIDIVRTGAKDAAGTVSVYLQSFVIVKSTMSNNDIQVTAKHISTSVMTSGCTVDRLTGYAYENIIPITTCVNRLNSNAGYPLVQPKRVTISTTLSNTLHVSDQFKGADTVYNKVFNKGIASVYGAEILRNDLNVYLMGNIGSDRGTVLEIGKNVSSMQITNSIDKAMYSGVYAYVDGVSVRSGVVVDISDSAPVDADTIYAGLALYHDEDVEALCDGQQITGDININALMAQHARQVMQSQAEYSPSQFGKVDLTINVELNQIDDGDVIPELAEPILLGDTVTVCDPRLDGGKQKMQVVGLTRDLLTQRITRINLGVKERTLVDVIKEMR